MAAIASVSNVAIGARSVSCSAVATGADTLAFSVIAAAYLAAGGVASSAIYQFLTASHTDAAGTAAALAAAGAIISASPSANVATYIAHGDVALSVLMTTASICVSTASNIFRKSVNLVAPGCCS
jgi:hypothetical protein